MVASIRRRIFWAGPAPDRVSAFKESNSSDALLCVDLLLRTPDLFSMPQGTIELARVEWGQLQPSANLTRIGNRVGRAGSPTRFMRGFLLD